VEALDRDALAGRWTHSHEEDGPGTMVFRPAGWDFPPSRGRRSFELRPDGSLTSGKPGPTDQTVTSEGEWRLLPGNVLELDREGEPTRLQIVKIESDRLVVRK
jgi:hypothetical protein